MFAAGTWLFTLVTIILSLLALGVIDLAAPSDPSSANEASPHSTGSVALSYVITAFMIALSCLVIVLLPYWIAAWQSKLLHGTLRFLKLPLTERSLMVTKIVYIAVPVLVTVSVWVPLFNAPMIGILLLLTYVAAALSLFFFSVRHALVRR